MHPTFYESGATFVVLAAVALHVVWRRERSGVHWLLLTLLASMMGWTGGLSLFYYSWSGHEELARFSLTLAFACVFVVPPAWLMLAARQTHVRLFDRSAASLIAVLVPPAMTCLAVVTNPGHRLFVRDFDAELLSRSAAEWAGPVFWVGLAYGVMLMLAGSCLYLAAAYRMASSGQRTRGLVLATIVTTPIVLAPLIGFHLERDVTPALIGAMTVLLFVVTWRHRILDSLPIARRDLIEHLDDGVVLTGCDGAVLDANPAAETILGSKLADVRGRPLNLLLAELTDPEHRTEVQQSLAELIELAMPITFEFEASDERALEVDAGPVHGGDGETAGFYAVLRDRTEHRRYEKFLRQSQRLETVASLTAGIAHEVNNPLAFVRSNLNHVQRICGSLEQELRELGLGDTKAEIEELRQVTEESLEGLDRIATTIERMRRFSRLQERELGDVDLNVVVDDALRMARLRSGPELTVRCELVPHLPTVRGSREHLVQAVLNVIVNARLALAGRSAALIRIETARVGDWVEIRVIDNGPGIPDELQERIFDPFYTTRRSGEASGLGLAVAFGIVREHRGDLDLESVVGKGCKFVIRLHSSAVSEPGAPVRAA
ncbi:MAG: PAS domain S-box protein [Deltaproteobacteria bacterium]|nr:PAS domain S-box protein [Deltaproteobacteria bacterium]